MSAPGRQPNYLTTPITATRRTPAPVGNWYDRDGYTKRSGAPTTLEIQTGDLWYRVWVWQFSNAGTAFVRIGRVACIVPDHTLPVGA